MNNESKCTWSVSHFLDRQFNAVYTSCMAYFYVSDEDLANKEPEKCQFCDQEVEIKPGGHISGTQAAELSSLADVLCKIGFVQHHNSK